MCIHECNLFVFECVYITVYITLYIYTNIFVCVIVKCLVVCSYRNEIKYDMVGIVYYEIVML